MYTNKLCNAYTLPGETSSTPAQDPASPKLAPAALLTGTVLLDAKSKVIKPKSSFAFWLASRKDLHG